MTSKSVLLRVPITELPALVEKNQNGLELMSLMTYLILNQQGGQIKVNRITIPPHPEFHTFLRPCSCHVNLNNGDPILENILTRSAARGDYYPYLPLASSKSFGLLSKMANNPQKFSSQQRHLLMLIDLFEFGIPFLKCASRF